MPWVLKLLLLLNFTVNNFIENMRLLEAVLHFYIIFEREVLACA
jgi:hypothetical protein